MATIGQQGNNKHHYSVIHITTYKWLLTKHACLNYSVYKFGQPEISLFSLQIRIGRNITIHAKYTSKLHLYGMDKQNIQANSPCEHMYFGKLILKKKTDSYPRGIFRFRF